MREVDNLHKIEKAILAGQKVSYFFQLFKKGLHLLVKEHQIKIQFQNRRKKWKKVGNGASEQENKEVEETETENFCKKKIAVKSPEHSSAKLQDPESQVERQNILILKICDYTSCTSY